MVSEWEQTGMGNTILAGDGFWISYNPDPQGGCQPVGVLMDFCSAITGFSNDVAETALCNNNTALVLNGDFRQRYEDIVSLGYDACLAVYNELKAEHRSPWSEDAPTDPGDYETDA